MSLKVWLPLLTNFNNQGTFINNPTNSGATASTSGPLGGSYSFDGTNDKIYTIYPSAETEMTVCMWVTFTKLNVHLLDMRNQSGVGYQPAYVGTSGIQVGGSNGSFPYINFVPTLNTWYHLAIVYSASKTQLYVDGIFYGESTSSKGYNFNMNMEVHLGSRYSNTNWFGGNIADFRIYNEALSAYEIKKIAQGLLLHYTHPDGTRMLRANTPLSDASGFGRNATPSVAAGYAGYATGRYDVMWYVGSSDNYYYSLTSPSANTNTISFWLRTPKTSSTVFFADYKSKMAFGFNGSGYIIATCDSLNKGMFASTAIIADTPQHIVIRKNAAGDDVELFVNGVQQTTRYSNNYWTHSTDTLMIGRRSTGTPMECYFDDFRMYASRLSDNDILELYHTSLKQLLSNGKSNPFEIVEDTLEKVQVKKNGLLVNGIFVESNVGNKFKATQVVSNEFIER